jgi:hypothetical protein
MTGRSFLSGVFAAAVICGVTADTVFLDAFSKTFSRNDKALVASTNTAAVRWIQDIMQRQGVSGNATELRELGDAELLSIAMRAAVGGISHWRRVPGTALIVVNEKTGIPYAESMTVDLEVPVYISIICVMVVTIVLQHMRLNRIGSPVPAAVLEGPPS